MGQMGARSRGFLSDFEAPQLGRQPKPTDCPEKGNNHWELNNHESYTMRIRTEALPAFGVMFNSDARFPYALPAWGILGTLWWYLLRPSNFANSYGLIS